MAQPDIKPTTQTVGVIYIHNITGYHPDTIRGWVHNGTLPTPISVKPYRWAKHAIDRWLQETYTNVEAGKATKVCTVCRQAKPLSEFHRLANSPDGHQYTCKECAKKQRAKYRTRENTYQRDVRAEERRELAWYRENYPQEGKPWNEQ